MACFGVEHLGIAEHERCPIGHTSRCLSTSVASIWLQAMNEMIPQFGRSDEDAPVTCGCWYENRMNFQLESWISAVCSIKQCPFVSLLEHFQFSVLCGASQHPQKLTGAQ